MVLPNVRMTGLVLSTLVALFLVLPGASAAPSACNMSQAKVNTAAGRSTTSTTFVNVASLNFVQHGAGPGCVVVQFSAAAGVDAGGFLQIGLLLDDVLQTTASFADSAAASHSMTFLIPNVSPGVRRVKIGMRSVGGEEVSIQDYTLVIFYVP